MNTPNRNVAYTPAAGPTPLVAEPTGSTSTGIKGVIVTAVVTAAGSTNATLYDSPTAASGTVLGVIPSTATVGQSFQLFMAFMHGVTVSGATTAPAFTLSLADQ